MSLTDYLASIFNRRGRKIQVRQGLSTDFDDTKLDVGEIGLLLDTNDVRIGLVDGTTASINNGGEGNDSGLVLADIPNSSNSERGFMTSQQFIKLNGIEANANFTFVENVLNSTSTENAFSAAKGKEVNDKVESLALRVETIELNGTGSTITLNNTLTSTSTTQGATANTVRIVNDSINSHKEIIASATDLGHVRVGNNIDIVPNGTISVKNASTVNKGVVQLSDDLVTNDSSKGATAKTVYELKQLLDNAIISGGGNVTTVVNNLDSTSGTDALSAGMGNIIKQELDNKASQSDLDELDEFVRENVITMGVPVTQNEKDEWNSKSNFNGDYNELSNKPTIPTVVDGTNSTSTMDATSANTSRILKGEINDVLEQLNTHSTNTDIHMSPSQVLKLNGISSGANFVKVEDSLTSTSSTSALSAKQGNEISNQIGLLSLLQTTSKSNLVDAINEVKQVGNNVKQNTVDALLSVDDSLPITANSTWDEIITQIRNIKVDESGGGDEPTLPENYELATDEDFSGTSNGAFTYIGTKKYVIVPEVIKGINITSYANMFKDNNVIKGVVSSNKNVNSISYMFYNCSSLTSLDLSNFDTSNVTNFSSMFFNCSSLTSLDLSHFNTSKASIMDSMFSGCSSLTSLDLSNFDTSNVTNFSSMFFNCSSLTSLDLSHFTTTNVTNMLNMFSRCSSLTSLDLSSFDTSNVTNTTSMVYKCTNVTFAYARTQTDADKLNSSVNKPTTFTFIVKP